MSNPIAPAMTALDVFDQEQTVVVNYELNKKGLELPAGGYPGVVWGIVSYQGYGMQEKANTVIEKRLIVIQLPVCPDDNGLPIVVWVYANESFGEKSSMHKHLMGMYGGPIGLDHQVRMTDGSGNIDPKKLFGMNCTVNIVDKAKPGQPVSMGVGSLTTKVAGMPDHQINPGVPMPEYIAGLKQGKDMQKGPAQQTTAPVVPQHTYAPVTPQAAAVPVQPQAPTPQQAAPVPPVQPPAAAPVAPTPPPQHTPAPAAPVPPVQPQAPTLPTIPLPQAAPVAPVQPPAAAAPQAPVTPQVNANMFPTQ